MLFATLFFVTFVMPIANFSDIIFFTGSISSLKSSSSKTVDLSDNLTKSAAVVTSFSFQI